jgi:uncharacterized ferritin-like protein (DUF455 family)
MEPPDTGLDAFCRRILLRGDLTSKLEPPPDSDLQAGTHGAAPPNRPARDPGLAMEGGAAALPRPGQLADPALRAVCLARFAHHELMAVELFAWALLRWPDVPPGLRKGWRDALADEQRHCKLYLERLAFLGSELGEHPQADYFWKQVPGFDASPHGPRAFLAGLGLTLEQANLDFTLAYRDAFREAGDEASARVFQEVYEDEIQHVALAARWLSRLSPDEAGDPVAAYDAAVPYPLAASRAKGRRFNAEGRRAAGLSEPFIEHVRRARSSQELASANRPPGERP